MFLVLFDNDWQFAHIAANRSSRQGSRRIDLIGDTQNAFIGPVCRRDIGNHQGSRVQTPLIVGALEVLPSKIPHGLVIPPQEECENDIEAIGAHDLAPDSGWVRYIERSHLAQSRHGERLLDFTLRDVDRDQDQQSNDTDEDDNNPPQKRQKLNKEKE